MKLPPAGTIRWTARQKAAVIEAVRDGSLGVAEACSHYRLSEEEFEAWQRAFERDGVVGLQLKAARRRRQTQPPSSS